MFERNILPPSSGLHSILTISAERMGSPSAGHGSPERMEEENSLQEKYFLFILPSFLFPQKGLFHIGPDTTSSHLLIPWL
jgi:hypothetical protein